jgi:DNA polymerase-3 subunit delta'
MTDIAGPMTPVAPLPWHQAQHLRIERQRAGGKLPHAMLFTGQRLLGKGGFATYLAASLLCRRGDRCGECSGCHLFSAGSHPDVRFVMPEDSRAIVVDQIRALHDWMNQTAQQSGYRVAVVQPAQAMNLNAANAFLKGLEEPGRDTLLILVTDQPGRLLPTVRSRCQRVDFTLPPRDQAIGWLVGQGYVGDVELHLDLAGGNPIRVLTELGDEWFAARTALIDALTGALTGQPPAEMAALISADVAGYLRLWYTLVMDGVRLAMSGDAAEVRNRDQMDFLRLIVGRSSPDVLLQFVEKIGSEFRLIETGRNPNPLLLAEGLMIDWGEL